jgi:hypothetical protein
MAEYGDDNKILMNNNNNNNNISLTSLSCLLETVGLCVPTRYLGDFYFSVCSVIKSRPSDRYTSTSSVICSDYDIIRTQKVPLNPFYYKHTTSSLLVVNSPQ